MDMGESHDEERGMDMWESHDGLPDPGPEGSDEQGSHHLVDWEESALWAGAAPGPVPGRGAGPGDSRGRPGPRQERPSGALDLGDSSLSGPGRRPGRGPRPWGFLGRGDPRQLWTRPRSLSRDLCRRPTTLGDSWAGRTLAGMDLESPIFFEASRFPKKENVVCR